MATKQDALANAEAEVVEHKSLKEKRAAELRSRREAESSFFDNLAHGHRVGLVATHIL